MPLRNSGTDYGAGAKSFHWLLFALLAFMYFFGTYLEGVEPKTTIEFYNRLGLHKSIGITILALVFLRFVWRLVNPPPPLPADLPAYQKWASQIIHWLLYAIMFAIPISGWLYSSISGVPVSVFGWFTLPDLVAPHKELKDLFHSIHGFFGDLLVIVFTIHVLAALYHHFWRKDTILFRMLPFVRVRESAPQADKPA